MKWNGANGRWTLWISVRGSQDSEWEETHDYQSKEHALRHFARLAITMSATPAGTRWNWVQLWDNKTDEMVWELSYGGGEEELA